MKHLKVPTYALKLKSYGHEKMVFDRIRKKYVHFTPEEFVRQNIITHLVESLYIPESLISIEKGIQIHGLFKRYDIAVLDPNGKPLLIIECKAPSVKIKQNAIDQVIAYSSPFNHIYLMLSNGQETYCGLKKDGQFDWLDYLPDFEGLKN